MDKDAKVIGQYKNGNYWVYMMSDGTKIRYTDDDELKPEFPESVDLCVTKRCKQGCQFCYENCVPDGKTWDYNRNLFWLNTLQSYTELAINGNDWDDIPEINKFLAQMKSKRIIVNATFHLERYLSLVEQMQDYQKKEMLYGLGVSVNKVYDRNSLMRIFWCDNTVVHLVAGLFNEDIFNAFIDVQNYMKDVVGNPCRFKVLLLGYKNLGRGMLYKHLYPEDVRKNMDWLYHNIDKVMETFEVVTFDNLALEQLQIKNAVSSEIWETGYMGDDGQFTMYIDAVDYKYAVNSREPEEHRRNIFEQMNISDMFRDVQKMRQAYKDAEEKKKLDSCSL